MTSAMIVAAASLLSAACASILGLDNGTPEDTGIDASRDQTGDLTVDNAHGDSASQDVVQEYDLDVPMSDGNLGDGCTLPPDACSVFCGLVNACGQGIQCNPCDAACESSTGFACNGIACGTFPDNCG